MAEGIRRKGIYGLAYRHLTSSFLLPSGDQPLQKRRCGRVSSGTAGQTSEVETRHHWRERAIEISEWTFQHLTPPANKPPENVELFTDVGHLCGQGEEGSAYLAFEMRKGGVGFGADLLKQRQYLSPVRCLTERLCSCCWHLAFWRRGYLFGIRGSDAARRGFPN